MMPTNLESMYVLQEDFYRRNNVVLIAKELIGKVLCTHFDGIVTYGRIVETEAYNGIIDKASHAFGGRRTARTEVMYLPGGHSYVYLCYGMHHLFNVVTNVDGIPHAILIRAVEPLYGLDEMLLRTRKSRIDHTITRGPGNVSKALGITVPHSGTVLHPDNGIWIADDGFRYADESIVASARIGVAYAKEDALLPYRFYAKGNKYVSGKRGI